MPLSRSIRVVAWRRGLSPLADEVLGHVAHPVAPAEVVAAVQVEAVLLAAAVRLVEAPVGEGDLFVDRGPHPLALLELVAAARPVEILGQARLADVLANQVELFLRLQTQQVHVFFLAVVEGLAPVALQNDRRRK